MFNKIYHKFTINLSKILLVTTPPFIIWKPHLYQFKGKQYSELVNKMYNHEIKPGDIFVRKFRYSITSKMVPGYFTHVGLYIGKDKNNIPTIIHADSGGVREITACDFLRTDDIIVLRIPNITNKMIADAITKAKNFLGNPYDFNFSYGKDHRFYCSELIGRSYEHIEDVFKFSYIGYFKKRKTLLPDDLVKSNFEIIFKSNSKSLTKFLNKNKIRRFTNE